MDAANKPNGILHRLRSSLGAKRANNNIDTSFEHNCLKHEGYSVAVCRIFALNSIDLLVFSRPFRCPHSMINIMDR